MKPEIIYLQQCDNDNAVTWCEDKINANDVEYVRADLVERILALVLIKDVINNAVDRSMIKTFLSELIRRLG